MRTLPAGVATVAAAAGYTACLAVEINTATPIRVTDNPLGVTIVTHFYTYGFLAVSETEISDAPAVTVQLANADNAISMADLDGTPGGGIVGKTAKVYEVHWDASGAQLDPVTLFDGLVVGYAADGEGATLTIQNPAETSGGMVGRIVTRLCPYVFASPTNQALGLGLRCGYTGAETWCDHTHARCTVLANTGRYGGFLGMPTLGTQVSYYLNEYTAGTTRMGTNVGPAIANPPAPPAVLHVGLPTRPDIASPTNPIINRPPVTLPPGEGGEKS